MDASDIKNTPFKEKLKKAYKVYQFVAKVFLYSILIILVLVAFLVVFYFIDLVKNEQSGETKSPLFGAYVIISPSMVPTIKVEDAIIIMRKEPEELEKNDIITFLSSDPRYSGLTITHRIVGIEKSEKGEIFFRTKGDNNNAEDTALVPSRNVYGKVILKIPKIGYIQYLLTQAFGWILLVVVPCFGIVIYDIIKLVRSVRGGFSSDSNKKELKQEVKTVEIIGEAPTIPVKEVEEVVQEHNEDNDIEIL